MVNEPSNRFRRVGTYTNDQLLKDLRELEEEVLLAGTTPGDKGDKGDKGEPGADGIQGPKGDKGDQGATGPQGVHGLNGTDGSDGLDGDNAADRDDFGLIDADFGLVTVPAEWQEDLGDLREVQPDDTLSLYRLAVEQGYSGSILDFILELKGPQGDKGIKGEQGEPGAEGPEGPQGIQGIPGDEGPVGPVGADGADGAVGPAGPGLPVGGAVGEIIVKSTAVDYATAWSSIENALPDRLKAHDATGVADADTVTEFGISRTEPTTLNLPVAQFGVLFTLPSSGSTNVVVQYWYRTSSTDTYRRRMSASVWGAWETVLETQAVLDGRYAQLSAANTLAGLLTLSSGQLRFPAIALPSADAHTLDDYEEGSFVPRIDGLTSAGVGTYSVQNGKYTKIGNLVLFNVTIIWSAHTGAGSMVIEGLPFTVMAGDSTSASMEYSNLTYPNPPLATVQATTTRILLRSAATSAVITGIGMDTAATVRVSGFYFTD